MSLPKDINILDVMQTAICIKSNFGFDNKIVMKSNIQEFQNATGEYNHIDRTIAYALGVLYELDNIDHTRYLNNQAVEEAIQFNNNF